MAHVYISQLNTLPEIHKDLVSLIIQKRKFSRKNCCFIYDWSWDSNVDNFERCRKDNGDLQGRSCIRCKIWICDRHQSEMLFCPTCGVKLVHDND